MNRNNQLDQVDNMLLDDSSNMNQQQRAIFLNISKSRSVDSVFNKLLPHPNQIPDRERTLVWEPIQPQFTNNIIINHHNFQHKPQTYPNIKEEVNPGLKIFKSLKKPKIKTRCDYDKNICGYITKKVIRQFIGKHYTQQIAALMAKYECNFEDCRGFYLKRIQVITGPSHLNELLYWNPKQPQYLRNCKKAFKQFYTWFLKCRYLRYIIHEGKMTNKMAYIQYKNNYLFRYLSQKEDTKPQYNDNEGRCKREYSQSQQQLSEQEFESQEQQGIKKEIIKDE